MERFRGYLERLTLNGRSKERKLPAMPSLPDDRPQPLAAISPLPTATANSKFFKSLPSEIRRRILIEAFGERILHLDLRLEHPLKKYSKKDRELVKPRPERHANAHLFHPSLRDTTKAQEWTWWSCVCHSRFPNWNFNQDPPGVKIFGEEPAKDGCRDPFMLPRCLCVLYPGHAPAKCFIGVQGWLLVCRQAYIEGVDVLYSTNRFHIAYAELAICLPRLLPMQHLSAITAAELSWNLTLPPSEYFRWDADDKDGLQSCDRLALLARLPQILPNLRYLYLSLQDVLRMRQPMLAIGGHEMYEEIEEVLRKVDAMIVRMSQLQECRVALPLSLYSTRKLVEKGRDIDWRRGTDLDPETLWRNIPTSTSDAPTDLTTVNQSINGYWIVHGVEDMYPPPLPEAV
ncbi:hypothetical protein F4813DRAFT_298044 [Daldinia decipiens]|uniref:uncharacterized protein n=1 Tax=Daldinia decipiens TaxID=326647 RepID=UPI0020C51A30|nr:uncharacterized protein F4813DRAFT_298044 [Daldinia decipiens]KAI1660568.1 hypothetical protein F4813DRAFT_298044 [Daldinia decipiens]